MQIHFCLGENPRLREQGTLLVASDKRAGKSFNVGRHSWAFEDAHRKSVVQRIAAHARLSGSRARPTAFLRITSIGGNTTRGRHDPVPREIDGFGDQRLWSFGALTSDVGAFEWNRV